MQTVYITSDKSEAQTIQQRLYSANIPCYISEANGAFEIQVLQSDVPAAEAIVKPSSAPAEMASTPSSDVASPPQEKNPQPSEVSKTTDPKTESSAQETPARASVRCLRCQADLEPIEEATDKIREWNLPRALTWAIYLCPHCGHAEFFASKTNAPRTPSDPDLPKPEYERLWEKAETLAKQGQLPEAIQTHQQIVQNFPSVPRAIDSRRAIKILEQGLNLNVLVYAASNEREAQMIQQRLEDVDIRSRLRSLSSGATEILVEARDTKMAQAVLKRRA